MFFKQGPGKIKFVENFAFKHFVKERKKAWSLQKVFQLFLRRALKFETLGRFILKNAYTVYNFWAW